MTVFTKFLFTVTLFFCLFSCARKEQALYQKSGREQFARVDVPATTLPEATQSQSSADSDQVAANPDLEVSSLSVSTHTDVISNRPSPAWKVSSKVGQLVGKTTVNQPETYQKKRATRTSILKRLVADPAVQRSGMATASLVCGIVSFLIFGIVLGPLAIIFGGIALSKIKKNPGMKGHGLAVAGLVLGIVATVLTVIFLAAGTAQ